MKKKIKWLQEFDNNCKESVWYGGDIVEIEVGKYKITIGAWGEVRAIINGETYVEKNNLGKFKEYLKENHILNDNQLREAIENGKVEFLDNNWFEAFIWDSEEKQYVETCDTIIDELDKDDDFSWVKDWLKELVD